MKKTPTGGGPNASQRITNQIAELGDWRGKVLARLRQVIVDAAPDLTEEWKWGTAVWTNKGLVCSAGAFKDHVKLNFRAPDMGAGIYATWGASYTSFRSVPG